MASCLSNMMTKRAIKKKICKDLKRRARGFPGHPFLPIFLFSYVPLMQTF